MTRVVGLLLFGIAACSSKPAEPKVDPKAAAGFTRVLAAVGAAEPTQSASLLAQGAYETVAPSEKCLESFAAAATERARVEALLDCGLACTPDAVQTLKGKEPRVWMAALAGACEAPHFGLEKSDAAMLSPEWFLLHKIGQIAAPHIESAAGADRAALDKELGAFRLLLPLPAVATGLYELPVVAEEASAPVATRTYVVVPAKGALRVGATPHATLGPRGAAMASDQGRALFPGNEAAAGDLRALVLDAAGAPEKAASAAPPPDAAPPPADAAPAPTSKAELAKRQAVENARSAGVLGALSRMDSTSALGSSFGMIGLPPGLHGTVARDLRGDAFAGGEPIPLLLADGGRPAGEVIESATALPALLVAVASPEDPAARALAIEVRSVMNSSGSAPGQARIDLAPGGLDAARTAAGGAEETVVVRAADGTSWGDAVAVAAVAVARGARQVIITTAALDRGGSGGARGHGASDQPPTVSLITDGQPTASGDLDRSVIRRVIRSRMGAFRACYERELVRRANLAGKVDLEFTIGADGAVSKAKGSGLPVVADCAARQVKTIKFPPPRGGGVVNVRYPLTFEPKDE